MKIIFSRKGFDTVNGGYASPIIPDGTCYSIPIPGKLNNKKYCELDFSYQNEPIQKILNNITNKHIAINGSHECCDYLDKKFKCHNDPCLIETKNHKVFTIGQANAALGHLNNQKVQKGDIFLFYGLFRDVEKIKEKWQYKETSKPVHLIFASMEIDEIVKDIKISTKEEILKNYPYLENHPHLDDGSIKLDGNDQIYTGKQFKLFDYHRKRVLTDLDCYEGVSKWKLPINFDFSKYFSYIKDIQITDNKAYMQHRGYGQEFVLSLDEMAQNQQKQFFQYFDLIKD